MSDCPHAVAFTILQRHHDNRQRFDSADYEMARRVLGPRVGCTCVKRAVSDTIDTERESESKSVEYRDEIRCLRMQRFDSADWVLQTQRAKQTDSPLSDSVNVAQILMDRHALKRCAFVGLRPVKTGPHVVEKIKREETSA